MFNADQGMEVCEGCAAEREREGEGGVEGAAEREREGVVEGAAEKERENAGQGLEFLTCAAKRKSKGVLCITPS